MRQLTHHHEAGSEQHLAIDVEDPLIEGAESGVTRYIISGFQVPLPAPPAPNNTLTQLAELLQVGGPPGQGITAESLLAICCDRLSRPEGAAQFQHAQPMLDNIQAALMLGQTVQQYETGIHCQGSRQATLS